MTAMAGGGSPGSGLIEAENFLAQALRGVFALAEAYPDLKASDRFAGLQTELAQIEDDLQHARRYYNAVVRDLNTAVARSNGSTSRASYLLTPAPSRSWPQRPAMPSWQRNLPTMQSVYAAPP